MDWNIKKDQYDLMVEHCMKGFPLEACGLLIGKADSEGRPTGLIEKVWPAKNTEKSARIYSVDSMDMFEASKYAQNNGLEIVGVFHSHTHSEAYPSSTDIKQVVDPNWLYTIISLAENDIISKSFRINEDQVIEINCQIS